DDPVERSPRQRAHPRRIAAVAAYPPFAIGIAARVDADHDALRTERGGELRYELRPLERRRVDGDLVGARVEQAARLLDAADAASDADRDIEVARDAANPFGIRAGAARAGGDVVEHDLVGAGVAVAARELDHVAHVAVA